MTRQTRYGLNQRTIAAIGAILQRHPGIEKAIIYGSRALGTHKEGSDIDLTLVAPSLNIDSLLKIEEQIDDLMLPYKVDISLFHQIDNQNLRDHVERIGKQFWP